MADLIKDFGPPVAWIIALCSLLFNNHYANVREKRKEFRSEIDSISTTIKEVIKKLAEYYAQPTRDLKAKSLELDIKVLFKELDLKSDRIAKRKFMNNVAGVLDDCQEAMEAFFDQATGKYFETDDRSDKAAIQVNFEQVNICGLMLIESIHTLFLMEFDGLKN